MKYRRRIFTDDEVIRAKNMRLAGSTWKELGAAFDCDSETLRRVMEPGYAKRRGSQIAAWAYSRTFTKSIGPREPVSHRRAIPDEVLADRDKRSNAPRSLSALICGDPAPGQSALDKRGVA
jgi:hypothetical protein